MRDREKIRGKGEKIRGKGKRNEGRGKDRWWRVLGNKEVNKYSSSSSLREY